VFVENELGIRHPITIWRSIFPDQKDSDLNLWKTQRKCVITYGDHTWIHKKIQRFADMVVLDEKAAVHLHAALEGLHLRIQHLELKSI
jgi:hypothetical protein